MIINDKEEEIFEYLNIEEKERYNKIVEIKLKEIKPIINMSYMFYNCRSLSSLPDISKWNANNFIFMRYMFSYCSSLSSLPDISKWNTNHSTDVSEMFDNCILLLNISNLQKNN